MVMVAIKSCGGKTFSLYTTILNKHFYWYKMLIRAIKTTKLIRKGMSSNEKDLVLWYDRRKDVL